MAFEVAKVLSIEDGPAFRQAWEAWRASRLDDTRDLYGEPSEQGGVVNIPCFEPDTRWVVPARYVPYDPPRPVTLDSVVPGLQKALALFGRVEFAFEGREYGLEVYAGTPTELHIPFRDATSGVTTDPGARVLVVPLRSDRRGERHDVVLDFNRAENGPCALTPLATCALPPAGNTLPFAVEAGERLPVLQGRDAPRPH
jgi:uncharacterized protein